jgi:hypothetical protein
VIRLPRFAHRARPTAQPPRPARLYVRAGCGLCDEAATLLRPLERAGRLRVERVDVESDPELLRRYGLSIPVLQIGRQPALAWPFERRDVEAILR